jgi:hypothetical protein
MTCHFFPSLPENRVATSFLELQYMQLEICSAASVAQSLMYPLKRDQKSFKHPQRTRLKLLQAHAVSDHCPHYPHPFGSALSFSAHLVLPKRKVLELIFANALVECYMLDSKNSLRMTRESRSSGYVIIIIPPTPGTLAYVRVEVIHKT